MKLTELGSIQSRYVIAIGEYPDADSDGYMMLDVRKNFNPIVHNFDVYLSPNTRSRTREAAAPDTEAWYQRLMETSRREIREMCRSEIAHETSKLAE